ncbi:MAG: hypothetical protein HY319_17585 [Armatimonadetes bacterium]|nr:hypothetical protein [Armatimonadota bacterium]
MQVRPQTQVPARTLSPRYVSVGDSLTAGMQDATLTEDRQAASYPNLIARQAGLSFCQPSVDRRGIPPAIFLKENASLWRALLRYLQVTVAAAAPVAAVAAGLVPPEELLLPLCHVPAMGRVETEPPFQNLAIPGFELRHLTGVGNVTELMQEMADHGTSSPMLVALGPYVKGILQNGGPASSGRSEIDRAVEQQPDLVTLWAGNNDALESAIKSVVDDRTLTPMDDQRWLYHTYNPFTGRMTPHRTEQVMRGFRDALVGPSGAVTRLLEETEAHVVLLNIPDVTVIPYLRPVGQKVGPLPFRIVLPNGTDVTRIIEEWTIPSRIRGDGKSGRSDFPEGTYVGLGMLLSKFTEMIDPFDQADLERGMNRLADQGGVFTEDEGLDPDELALVRERTAEYNSLLRSCASAHERVHLVDIAGVLEQARQQGVPLRGDSPEPIVVTNTFTGQQDPRGYEGFFSYDGVHPSDVGQAVIANRILDAVRQEMADVPSLAPIAAAPPVDEKAIFRADPHRTGSPQFILSRVNTDPFKTRERLGLF